MSGADITEAEHADWIASLGDDSADPPERRQPYVSPWLRALAAELASQE